MATPSETRHHVFVSRSHVKNPKAASPLAAKSKYIVEKETAHFVISYDSILGGNGAQAAEAISQTCEADFATLQDWFGGITPPGMPFQIRLTTDSQGALHATCAATELFIGANSGGGVLDLPFMRQLVIAEEDEVFMDAFGHGWDCGASNGEGLSRVLANDITPGVEPLDFVSSNSWLNSDRPDWVNKTEQDDTKYISIGCSVLFLNWLRFQLNFTWKQIIAAGDTTLAAAYTNLTGRADGFARFKALLDQKFPPDQQTNLITDNPFPLN